MTCSYPNDDKVEEKWLFDQTALQELLTECGQDASRLSVPIAQRPHSSMGNLESCHLM